MHIIVRDVNVHHAKCRCETCQLGSGLNITEGDMWNDDVDDPRADFIEAYNRGVDPDNRIGAEAGTAISPAEKSKLLLELLDLENEGAKVVWPSREDKALAVAIRRSEVTVTIADEIQDATTDHQASTLAGSSNPFEHEATTRAEPASSSRAGSSNDHLRLLPEGPIVNGGTDNSMQHLLDLLEAEAAGLPVIWQGPDDKKNAVAFRLAIFQDLETVADDGQSSTAMPAEDPSSRLTATDGRGIVHVLQKEDALGRARVTYHPNKRPLLFDDLHFEKRRCRTRD